MRCAVKSCSNNNKTKPCEISFFNFPTVAALRKKWKNFCDRDETMNVKTSTICMKHFKAEDFENDFEYKMGFTRRRFLKKGAVPSIKKPSKSEQTSSERSKRAQKFENKKIVEMLLKQHPSTDSFEDETVCEPSVQVQDIPVLTEECAESFSVEFQVINETDDHFIDISKIQFKNVEKSAVNNVNPLNACDDFSEIDSLKNELNRLRKENEELAKANKKQSEDLNAATEKATKDAQIYEKHLNVLQKSLTKCKYKLSNLKVKSVKLQNWTEEDID